MYALNAGDDGFWLGVLLPNKLVVEKIVELYDDYGIRQDESKRFELAIPNIERFTLFRDTIYYRIRGTEAVQKDIYNPDATSKEVDVGGEVRLSKQGESATDFSGETLHDFYSWTDFQLGDINNPDNPAEFYRVVWSIQTGYFIVNQNNRLVGHIYGNFTPFQPGNPFRVDYTGGAYVGGNRVFLPILRSGQVEVVNREAVTDRIIDEGSGRKGAELVAFRPLGLELLTLDFDFSRTTIPQTAKIGRELVMSGPLLNWSDGQHISEYQFTERPSIKKTTKLDFDKWAYSDLDVTLPSVQDLNRDQYNEVRVSFESRTGPYLVETLIFTGTNVSDGIGSTWKGADSQSVTNRRLRFNTRADGSIATGDYWAILDNIKYNTTLKALVVTFTSAQTLTSGRDYPQGIVVNGVRYEFNRFVTSGGTVEAYMYGVDSNPFSLGSDYEVTIPKSEIIRSKDSAIDIQAPTVENGQTNLLLVLLKLLRFKNITGNNVKQVAENLNNAGIRFGQLNQHPDRGALTNGANIRAVVGVRANVPNQGTPPVPPTDPVPPTYRTVTVPSVNGSVFEQNAYRIETRGPTRYVGNIVAFGGLIKADGTRYGSPGDPARKYRDYPEHNWIVTQRLTTTYFYRLNTTTRHIPAGPDKTPAQPIHSLGQGFVRPLATSGDITGGFSVRSNESDGSNSFIVLAGNSGYYYNNLSLYPRSNATATITFNLGSGSWRGGVEIAGKYWFINDSTNRAVEYNKTGSATGRSISLGSGNWRSAFTTDDRYMWVMDGNTAKGFQISDQSRQTALDYSFPSGSYIGVTGYSAGGAVTALKGTTATFLRVRSTTTTRREQVTPGRPGTPGTPGMPAVNVPISYGLISSARITETTIDLAGIWTTGESEKQTGELYLLFKGPAGTYASGSAIHTELNNLLENLTFRYGEFSVKIPFSSLVSRRDYRIGNDTYARYSVSGFNRNANLRDNIIFPGPILITTSLFIQFRKKEQDGFVEAEEIIEPAIMSMEVGAKDQDGVAKNINNEALNNNLIIFDTTDRNKNMSVFFANETFVNTLLSDTDGNHFYQATVDNPLIVNSQVFDFESPPEALILRYPLVDVNPVVSAESQLSAEVYNYKCCYKWIDDNGIEHRSQFSDIIQLITNTPMGEPGNRPTLEVRNINLTNKLEGSIGIEIYRTKNKSQTFQLVKEVQNDRELNLTEVRDDVLDSELGQVSSNDKAVVSGCKYVTPYKGRFVFYGFPEKPERIIVSSKRRPFTNDAIAFNNAKLAGDLIEILMEQEVVNVQALDDFLFISCTNGAYVWQITEGSLAQQEPTAVTGLGNLRADNYRSSVETSEGILFNTSEGRGIHLVTRGLSWSFVGEAVKELTTREYQVLSVVKKEDTDDVVFVLGTLGTGNSRILVYNQRYKIWTTIDDISAISLVNWVYIENDTENDIKGLTALTSRGEIFQQATGFHHYAGQARQYIVETGWLNFSGGYQDFQKIYEMNLLATFARLKNLTIRFDYDFIDAGPNTEYINSSISGDMITINGMTIPVNDLRQFRFQPRNTKCSAIKVHIIAGAESAEFNALRFGIGAGRAIMGESYLISSNRGVTPSPPAR